MKKRVSRLGSVRGNVVKMYIFYFLLSLHFLGGVLIPFFTEWGGISFTQIMILQSWFIFWAAVLSVPCGVLADTWGRKRTLVTGAAIHAIAPLVYASRPSFFVFLLGEFLWAAAVALIAGPGEALIYDSLKAKGRKKEVSTVFGRLRSISLAAMLIGAPMGSLFAVLFGLRAPTLFLAFPFSAGFLVTLTLKEPGKQRTSESSYFATLKSGFRELASNRPLRRLALDFAVVASLSKMMLWLYQPVLLELGVEVSILGIVHAAVVAVEIAVVLSLGTVERWLGGRDRLFLVTGIAPGLAFLTVGILQFHPTQKFLTFVGALIGIFTVLGTGPSRQPLFSDEFNKRISSEKRATVLSAITMLRHVLSAVLNPIVGAAADQSLALTLVALGVLLTAFAIFSRLWMRKNLS